MNVVIISLYLLTGLYLYAFIFHLIAAIQKPVDKKLLALALCTFSGAFLSVSNIYAFQAKDITEIILPLKLTVASSIVIYCGIFWFVTLHTQKISTKLPIWFSLLFTFIFVINLIQPYSLQFETINSLHEYKIWGNSEITGVKGNSSSMYALAGFVILMSLIYQQYVLLDHYFSNRKRSDLFMALSFGVLIICTLQGLLVRLGIIHAVPLGVYGLALLLLTWSLVISLENRHQLRLRNFIYESSGEAIILTDKDNKIVSVNPAFTEATGYSLEEVLGKNPNILNAKKQDKAFYADMWKDLNTSDCWQGEIWNRRKNGEIYPEWLKIKVVRNSNNKVINYIASFTDITESKKKEESIKHLEFYDGLTGLPNRQLMLKQLSDFLQLSAIRQQRGAVLFIDLNNVKSVNEALGHKAGDLLLIEMSHRIQRCLGHEDTIARIGGDIYGVILNGLSIDKDIASLEAKSAAIRIQNAINEPFRMEDKFYNCNACIGISVFLDHEITVGELVKEVDAAMYQAKKKGRGQIQFFDAETQSLSEKRFNLEALLRASIPDQLELFYQSQVDVHGNIFGAEALIRWNHPDKGMISPADFIPLAEESGLILPIGDWVFETVCLQLKSWEENPKTRNLILSVNVSAKQFHKPMFVENLLEIIEKTAANPCRLKLELTESILAKDLDSILQKMIQLKAQGITLSLDDFGTGFSSLSYLKRLPLDQLKIDQSFVNDIEIDPNETVIVKTIIALGQSLGLSVIAEGVETKSQKALLEELGCTEFQGYLFSKPLKISEFNALLQSK